MYLKMSKDFSILWLLCSHVVVNGFFLTSGVRQFRNSIQQTSSSRLSMGFDTIISVTSYFEAKCTLNADKGYSLSNYMQLPVEQYVCIKMPLAATLSRIDTNRFNLTVPPVRFFNLDVSPTLICYVTQSEDSVVIESSECFLRGSPYVASLNGCYKMKIKTVFKWTDASAKKSILSNSKIYVEVDPPAPFKYFSKKILESTGNLAMSIALRQIENAFVSSLTKDYEKWVTDKAYRDQRAGLFAVESKVAEVVQPELILIDVQSNDVAEDIPVTIEPVLFEMQSPVDADSSEMAFAGSVSGVPSAAKKIFNGPEVISDDICLIPGEPVVRVEDAPSNSRRIFTGIDIAATVDDVWSVLTDYENLGKVVPSLVKNEVLYRTSDGGARLSQVGGAKVLPGVTFTAKTILDVKIYTEDNPIPSNMVATYIPSGKGDASELSKSKTKPLQRDLFPRPYAITSLPQRDVTMQNVVGEGDFEHYQGIWRVQPLPNCAMDGTDAARLTYAVEIKPKGMLPVGLIEGRIATDLKANLEAIRKFVENKKKEEQSIKDTVVVAKEPSLDNISIAQSSSRIDEMVSDELQTVDITTDEFEVPPSASISSSNVVVVESAAASKLTSTGLASITTTKIEKKTEVNDDFSSFSLRRFFGFSKSRAVVAEPSPSLLELQLQEENQLLRDKIVQLESEVAKAKSIIEEIEGILLKSKSE